MNDRFFVPIGALGLVTIAAYGVWVYSFGVLLDPILETEGWSEGVLTVGFGASIVLGGVMAVGAGKVLDRVGSSPIFITAALVGTVLLVAAAGADTAAAFVVLGGLGGATVNSLGQYHITQTTAVRVAGGQPARALAWLTILGAFSSAIYLPLAAVLVDAMGWRGALRTMAIVTGAAFVLGAVMVRDRPEPRGEERARVRDALRDGYARRFLMAVGLAGMAFGVVVVYQVPLMTDAGLAFGVAAWFAGARGVAQVTGRIPLTGIVDALGSRRALRLAYASVGLGAVLLWFAGNVVVAGLFVLVTGFGVGASSPLHGLHADELFGRAALGALMGILALVLGAGMALGPALAGLLSDATGTRGWSIVIAAATSVGAVALLFRPGGVSTVTSQ